MFTNHEREIYQCPFTGNKYDPLALRRGLLLARGYNDAARGMSDSDPVAAAQAEEQVLAIGRKVFALPPVDAAGQGITDQQVLDALAAFAEYLRGKARRAQSSGLSAPCTDCPPR